MEACDPFPDDVHASVRFRPEPAALQLVRWIPQCRQIVRECIKPNPHHLVGVSGHGNPPAPRPRARPRNTYVVQAPREELLDLSGPLAWLDPQPSRRESFTDRPLVAGEAEKPIVFFHRLRRPAVLRAQAFVELVDLVELLAPDAGEASVGSPLQGR